MAHLERASAFVAFVSLDVLRTRRPATRVFRARSGARGPKGPEDTPPQTPPFSGILYRFPSKAGMSDCEKEERDGKGEKNRERTRERE